MQTWAVLGPGAIDGDATEDLFDPQQRLRALLDGAGPEVAWNDDDGQVMSYEAVGLEVTAAEGGRVLAGGHARAAGLHLTDRRIVAVAADAPGPGRHLVAQVDFLCLAFLAHLPDPGGDPDLRRVEIGGRTGEPGERAVEVIATSVAAQDLEAVVQGLFARTRLAQSRGNLRPLSPEIIDSLMRAGVVRGADTSRAEFTLSSLTMPQLAALAYPRRYAAPVGHPGSSV